MANLVSLSEAKTFLRVDHSDDDQTIDLMIKAASDAVQDVASAWDGEGEVPARIKLAVLSRIAVSYDTRTSVAPGEGETGMLTPLRTLEV